jgi:hypothetical protein
MKLKAESERLEGWEAGRGAIKLKAESSRLKGKIHRPDEIRATEISLGRQSTRPPASPSCRLSLRAGSHRA